MFGREPKLPIDSLFQTPETESNKKSENDNLEELKERLQHTQEIVKRISKQSSIKQKETYDKRAEAAKIDVGDSVLVKILAYNGKHKIADKFEPKVYTIISQPYEDIPVYEIKSPSGIVKKLHRNHLFPVGSAYSKSLGEIKEQEAVKPHPKPRPKPRLRKKSVMDKETEKLTEELKASLKESDDESGDDYISVIYSRRDALYPATRTLEAEHEEQEERVDRTDIVRDIGHVDMSEDREETRRKQLEMDRDREERLDRDREERQDRDRKERQDRDTEERQDRDTEERQDRDREERQIEIEKKDKMTVILKE